MLVSQPTGQIFRGIEPDFEALLLQGLLGFQQDLLHQCGGIKAFQSLFRGALTEHQEKAKQFVRQVF